MGVHFHYTSSPCWPEYYPCVFEVFEHCEHVIYKAWAKGESIDPHGASMLPTCFIALDVFLFLCCK